jgi:repressor LexA
MLTKKQHELLMFIHERIKETGVSPSFDEMKEALDLASKSGIHRLITALEERGFIRRLAHRARALEVVKLPEQATAAAPARGRAPFKPDVIEGGGQNRVANPIADVANDVRELPLLGKIAAGTPIAAIQHETDRLPVPETMLGSGEHYLLEIEGDSMIEAGILDGDMVVIKRVQNATSGEIVVALVEGEEATLKRLRKKGQSIALEPANRNYETRIFGPDQVEVQGKLVGLIRRYH